MLPGVIESPKPRYVGRSSLIAFPLYVGLEVQATKLPRLHSFAYHTGIRSEPSSVVTHKLADRISWNTARSLIEVYSAVIHPIFRFFDMDIIYKLCERHWHGQPQDIVVEAMTCGIIGLASLFSNILTEEIEMWVISHAKEILEDSIVSRYPSLEMVAAWILRTIYVRCTGRPHVTWMCSCSLMHLVEATGLHQASEFIMQAAENATPSPEIADTVNRTVHVAHSVHILIAFEYGRSMTAFSHQALEPVTPAARGTDLTPQLCELVRAIPTNQIIDGPLSMAQQLHAALEKLTNVRVDHDFLTLVRADLVLSIYRKLRVLESGFSQKANEQVIAAGVAALSAARRLASQDQPWWNVIGAVFQFTCALLAMDTPESYETLSETVDSLEFLVGRFNTHLAKEALSTAKHLVRASLERKRKGVATLERIVREVSLGDSDEADGRWSPGFGLLVPSLNASLSVDMEDPWGLEAQNPV